MRLPERTDDAAATVAEHPRLELRRLRRENADLRAELAELRRLATTYAMLSDPEAELEQRRAWWIDGRRTGFASGVEEGRRQALVDMAAEPIDVSEPMSWPSCINAELDRLRYPPQGRARFGDPSPGDFTGTEPGQ